MSHPSDQDGWTRDPAVSQAPGESRSIANSAVPLGDAINEVDVSIILPCLNERATLAGCIDQARIAIQCEGLSGEIIVADNGSTDGCVEIATSMGARVVEVARRGYGVALIHGCRAASGRYLVIGDADASYDLGEGIAMVRALRQGYDLVIGSRLQGTILPGAMPWKNRHIGNPVLTGILNLFFRAGISDAHCGLRAMRREAFERMDLRCSGMEFASEMIVKAVLLNMRRTEIPITYYPDGRDRPPHLRPWRDGWRHLRFLLLFSPLWLYLIPGAGLLLGGISLNTFLTLIPERDFLTFGSFFLGTHWTIPATLAAIFGLQTLFLGLIASMYSVQTGIYPASRWHARVLRNFSLEGGLVGGLALILIGSGIEGFILLQWIVKSFGPLAEFRLGMFGLMWIVLGAEILFNSFVLGLIAGGVETLPPAHTREVDHL
ncbi:MAG: glycosyltransferase family 2 protein [Chloroflexi bacterium]|nr:glycosyltransferase family 2 protein [Chloroflexota bacterium]